VRENGGQYTHAALWVVAALARLGRNEEAARLLEVLSPVGHARTPAAVTTYQVEPYVVAADVYDNPQHPGRGGWTWYTGSAGWMLRVALEELLGVTIEGGRNLVVRPNIPASWPGFRVRLRPFGRPGTWDLTVRNRGQAGAVASIQVDGRPVAPDHGLARIPMAKDDLDHRVDIELR
jgi:N,N'-diacetylchitobiose phosphorylase